MIDQQEGYGFSTHAMFTWYWSMTMEYVVCLENYKSVFFFDDKGGNIHPNLLKKRKYKINGCKK